MTLENEVNETADNDQVEIREPVYEHDQPSESKKELKAAMEAGRMVIDGVVYWRNSKGQLIPEEMVRPADQLIDEEVRKIMYYGKQLSDQITRFKGYSFEDMSSVQAMIFDEYGLKVGGEKGNLTLSSFDGSMKTEIKQADIMEFGPEIDVAKQFFDECISEWTDGGDPKVKALVTHAFRTGEDGRYNKNLLFGLLRYDIDDPRWNKAKKALQDAIHITGTKSHLYMKKRSGPDGKWENVVINLASS